MSALNLLNVIATEVPYPHFVKRHAVDPKVADGLLTWLESSAPWQERRIAGFFEVQDIDLRKQLLPALAAPLVHDENTINAITDALSTAFPGVTLGRVRITAHRLLPGYKIASHTDYGDEPHAFRFLLQLNRGWTLHQGGLLALFDTENPTSGPPRNRLYVPEHGLGIAFPISPRSFHAVTEVTQGIRYTVCYSFDHAERPSSRDLDVCGHKAGPNRNDVGRP